jgi:hypothetical protein
MMELTARHAEAWNSAWYGVPDDGLAETRAGLDAAQERVGRASPLTITVGAFVHYPDLFPTHDRVALRGSAEEIAEGLAAHAAQGCEHLIAWLVPGTSEALARFAEAVALFRAGN